MLKLLVAAFGREGLTYVRQGQQLGMDVRVLDCFDQYHKVLETWYGDKLVRAQGRRSDVRAAVAEEEFDLAIVQEETDYVRTALVTQSLREAGVKTIIVVTADAKKRSMYRRCGAHRVVESPTPERAWGTLLRYMPGFATA